MNVDTKNTILEVIYIITTLVGACAFSYYYSMYPNSIYFTISVILLIIGISLMAFGPRYEETNDD